MPIKNNLTKTKRKIRCKANHAKHSVIAAFYSQIHHIYTIQKTYTYPWSKRNDSALRQNTAGISMIER